MPILGQPEPKIYALEPTKTAGILGKDALGQRLVLRVKVGDTVKAGQSLCSLKSSQETLFLSPTSGTVTEIRRGDKRKIQSIIVTASGNNHQVSFPTFSPASLASLDREVSVITLQNGGLWQALRTRPFGAIPLPQDSPHSIFVTATDTRPLAPNPFTSIKLKQDYFHAGLQVLLPLTKGLIYLCLSKHTDLNLPDNDRLVVAEFQGPHPSGLVGTHIHFLDPVNEKKTVWAIDYQDIIAIGELVLCGRYPTARILSLCGSQTIHPRLISVRLGDDIRELCEDQINTHNTRLLAGSPLDGEKCTDDSATFIGRFQAQITALEEVKEHPPLAWFNPFTNLFSYTRALFSSVTRHPKKFRFSCSMNGSPRAIVPIATYEGVFPFRMLATQLLKAIIIRDTQAAQELGCLELIEEDLALCSFVCPAKHTFEPLLRDILEMIRRENA